MSATEEERTGPLLVAAPAMEVGPESVALVTHREGQVTDRGRELLELDVREGSVVPGGGGGGGWHTRGCGAE